MSRIFIRKGDYSAEIDTKGAQIISYAYNGYNTISTQNAWGNSAKVLFPQPGPIGGQSKELYDVNGVVKEHEIYTHNYGKYHMQQHGFAQAKDFTVVGKNDDSVVLAIGADDYTYNQYPYKFQFFVIVSINDKGELTYQSCAQNNDNKDMLAGQGWHPAFKLYSKDIENYKIIIKNLEKYKECALQEGVAYSVAEVINSGSTSKFTGIKSCDVQLVYEHDGGYIPYLSMHTEEPTLLFWSKKPQNEDDDYFICIEPWNTTPRQIGKLTNQNATSKLVKEGAVIIPPGMQSFLTVTISINKNYLLDLEHILTAYTDDRSL